MFGQTTAKIGRNSSDVQLYSGSLAISRLTVVSREAKKKQAVRDEWVCYLQVAPRWNLLTL